VTVPPTVSRDLIGFTVRECRVDGSMRVFFVPLVFTCTRPYLYPVYTMSNRLCAISSVINFLTVRNKLTVNCHSYFDISNEQLCGWGEASSMASTVIVVEEAVQKSVSSSLHSSYCNFLTVRTVQYCTVVSIGSEFAN
jgi:hypothetical protein